MNTDNLDVVVWNTVTNEFTTEVYEVNEDRVPLQGAQPMSRAEGASSLLEYKDLEWFVSSRQHVYIGIPKLLTGAISTFDLACAAVDAMFGSPESLEKIKAELGQVSALTFH